MNSSGRTVRLMLSLTLLSAATTAAQTPSRYAIVDSMRVGVAPGDHYALDDLTRRLYGAGRYIVNVDTKAVVDSFSDTAPGEGYVLARTVGHGLSNTGILFDLRTTRVIRRVPYSGDGITYDPRSRRAFLFAYDSTTVLDMMTGAVIARLFLPEAKESAVADGRDRVYANMEDSNAITVVDVRTLQLVAKYRLSPGTHPTGLAIDTRHHRLFASCDSLLVVVDADNGRVVTTLRMSGHGDQIAFDPVTQLLFMPNGKGKGLTIVHEDSPDHYGVVQEIMDDRLGSLHVIVDEKTHRVFMPRRFADKVLGFEVLDRGSGG